MSLNVKGITHLLRTMPLAPIIFFSDGFKKSYRSYDKKNLIKHCLHPAAMHPTTF